MPLSDLDISKVAARPRLTACIPHLRPHAKRTFAALKCSLEFTALERGHAEVVQSERLSSLVSNLIGQLDAARFCCASACPLLSPRSRDTTMLSSYAFLTPTRSP